jgi:uncharacterized protein (DUF1501 family)
MNESRREFLKKSGCALSMTALATKMGHLGAMSAMAQKVIDRGRFSEGGADYKALVLVYLNGGVDANNLVIPNDNIGSSNTLAMYQAARSAQGLALDPATLLNIAVPVMGGRTFGLHPSFGDQSGAGGNAGMHGLWAAGKMAVVTNVGTLVKPMTKTQYQNGSIQKPYQLFSHSDQVGISQTSVANTQSFTGWGGRLSDKMTAGSNPTALIPMVTSIAGAQLFTSGQSTLPMAIANANTSLANVLNPANMSGSANAAKLTAFNQIRTVDLDSNYIAAASHVTDLAMQANAALQASVTDPTGFPNTGIGLQLKQVARLIKRRMELNVNRQIFFVQIGGFDTHNGQLNTQATLISQVSQAVRAFYDFTVSELISDRITTFTLSDFGRTFNPAGTGTGVVGSDHAWGSHAFVVGGSVVGGNFYGNNCSNGTPFPTLTIGAAGPDDVDSNSSARGRWIPTTSVDEYAATLAKWFGLADVDRPTVFPNIGNFNTPNLGFMA